MATYRYRCSSHGDFLIEAPMSETTPWAPCSTCDLPAPKVLGNPNAFQFTYGKAEFHDGPDGTGETVRETADRWERQARARGLNPERTGYRHV